MKTVKEFKKRRDEIVAELNKINDGAEEEDRNLSPDEQSLWDTLMTERSDVAARIERAEEMEAEAKREADEQRSAGRLVQDMPADGITDVRDLEAEKPFSSLGEQLRSVFMAEQGAKVVDKRLVSMAEIEERAASGMNTVVDSEGGFPIQTDFAGAMFDSAAKSGAILSGVDRYEVTAASNSARWVAIDETTVSTTVFGGVQVYWEAESDATTKSKPVLKKIQLELQKLFGLAYATSEMMEDTTFLNDLLSRAFSLAIERKLEGDILAGDGAGKPLGIIGAAGTVSQAKESGQSSATIVYKNIVKMFNRHVGAETAAWLVHPDVLEQLMFMEFPVGTGGVPVFLPPGGASSAPFGTLLGRPIVKTDHCSALGTVGDIIFSDLKDYIMIAKGGTRADSSMHVRFLNDEQTFRFLFRANGQPKNRSTLTLKNTSTTRSTNVTLATRA